MYTVYGTNIYGSMFQENLESTLEETLRAAILKIKNCDQSIIFKTREGVVRLVQNQIKAIIYEKRHPVIYTDAGTYTVMNQSLKSIEASLDEIDICTGEPWNHYQFEISSTVKQQRT
ncbi:hypothetical protein MX850_10155 [Erysipelothrix sp. Poltava]|nr:hypothetical protein MX850_10155 [Erysipelothrix sp. Poltava]